MQRFIFILTILSCALFFIGCETLPQLRSAGRSAYLQNKHNESIEKFSKVMEIEPEDIEAHLYLARNYRAIGDKTKARWHYDQAVETSLQLAPDIPEVGDEAMDGLAEMLYEEGRKVQMANELERFKEKLGRPRDYTRQGVYLRKIEDMDNALVALKVATRLTIQLEKKRVDTREVLHDYRIENHVVDVTPFVELADMYVSINQADNAKRVLAWATWYNPDDERLQEMMNKLGMPTGKASAVEPDPFVIP